MKIHEYQAKIILKKYGLPISEGIVINDINQLDRLNHIDYQTYVVKAQIHAGGRGKAGGVKVCQTKEAAIAAARNMWGTQLITHQTSPAGQQVRCLYIESGSIIEKEYYLSVLFDRNTSRIVFIASTDGGVNIENVALDFPEKIYQFEIDPLIGIQPFYCRKLARFLDFKGMLAKQLQEIVVNLYNCLMANDANQIEINPLVITNDEKLLVLDAKMAFDDNALYRQPQVVALRDENEEEPLELRATSFGLSYVKMNGNIGCMVNGAGLAMATMDIIKLHGGRPANFLDVGGGADRNKVTEAFKIILSDTEVKAILVNIFGGIMKCNIIAEGIIAAAKDVGLDIPLVVRLAGTNFELGQEILNKSALKIISADNLADAAAKVVNCIN